MRQCARLRNAAFFLCSYFSVVRFNFSFIEIQFAWLLSSVNWIFIFLVLCSWWRFHYELLFIFFPHSLWQAMQTRLPRMPSNWRPVLRYSHSSPIITMDYLNNTTEWSVQRFQLRTGDHHVRCSSTQHKTPIQIGKWLKTKKRNKPQNRNTVGMRGSTMSSLVFIADACCGCHAIL